MLDSGISHRLVFVGRNTNHLIKLKQMAMDLGIDQHISFLENVEHGATLKIISDAAAFILPSRKEPFGIVLLEAAYLETAVIASETGGIPEVLGRDYPFFVEPDDVEALTAQTILVLSDRVARKTAIDNLKRRVVKHFGWHVAYSKYLQLIKECRKHGI